jgi:hypothetical protein
MSTDKIAELQSLDKDHWNVEVSEDKDDVYSVIVVKKSVFVERIV